MPTDKKLKSLVLNVMTEAQYNSATKNEDELYLTPDNSDEIAKVIPTDVAIKDNKLGLEHDSTWLTNQNAINLGSNMTYDEATKTLNAKGGGGTHKWVTIKYLSPYIAAKEYTIGEQINMGDSSIVELDGSELSVMMEYPAIFDVDGVVFTWSIVLDKTYSTRKVKACVYCIKPGTVTHATNYSLAIAANKQA